MTQPGNSEESTWSCYPISEAEIDEALEESFPASDPLPWTLGVEARCREDKAKHKEAGEDKVIPF